MSIILLSSRRRSYSYPGQGQVPKIKKTHKSSFELFGEMAVSRPRIVSRWCRKSGSLVLLLLATSVFSAPVRRNTYNYIQPLANGDALFELGNKSFIANVVNPKAVFSLSPGTLADGSVPLTVISTNESLITQNVLQSAVASYLEGDDVFSEDFLATVLVSSTAAANSRRLDAYRLITIPKIIRCRALLCQQHLQAKYILVGV